MSDVLAMMNRMAGGTVRTMISRRILQRLPMRAPRVMHNKIKNGRVDLMAKAAGYYQRDAR